MNVMCQSSIAVLAVMVVLSCVSCGARDYPFHEPKWPVQPVRMDLTQYGEYLPQLEFSADGTKLCAFWESTYQHGNTTVGPPLRIVVDVHGKITPEAVDSKGRLTQTYIQRFPKSVPRASGIVRDPLADSLKASTGYSEFLQRTGGWGFDRNLSLAVRQIKPRSAWNGRPNQDLHEDSGFALWTIELWQLSPKQERLWTIELPEPTASIGDAFFFQRDGKKLVALAVHPGEGYVLSQDDGKVVSRLRYNSFECERAPKSVIPDDATGPFKASQFAFDPSRDWLACGESTGRGVRVFSLHGSTKPVFEANVYDNPYLPKGGKWSVNHVEFATNGRYLIVDRSFGGRSTSVRVNATDIYETKTWHRVWWKNSGDISSVCLSPDGKKMAYIRHSMSGVFLEIGPFLAEEEKTEEDGRGKM